ncbi:AlpA family transcriptional regulator [Acidiphilium sp.]|uniref:helix-turn-helix transcriptional regulator n=1 Tax=Acidiphilium sp. TaxID=527 RepID=UPI00238FC2CF|nr:hypothetical protein [Acidiphilium sp.]MDE2328982.1 hypothetical protein [Rhodospirillales bacterium]
MELSDTPLTAKQACLVAGLSIAAFWRAVREKRMPAPVYPLPRAPRWFESEIRAALMKTRKLPSEAMAERRAANIQHAA